MIDSIQELQLVFGAKPIQGLCVESEYHLPSDQVEVLRDCITQVTTRLLMVSLMALAG